MLKNDMIDGIEYHFRKQGKRLTNLRKVPMSKLEEMIKKYNVNIVDELNELKLEKENAKKTQLAEYEERERLLDEKNKLCIKKYTELTNAQRDQFYEKIVEQHEASRNKNKSMGESFSSVLGEYFKKDGARVNHIDANTISINGITVHNRCIGFDNEELNKEQFISKLKTEILTKMYKYEKVLDEVIDSWFDIVVPVKKPKTKKVKKVKKVVEEPEQFCCCCSGKRDVWYNLGAPDTPMCPCNPDFEGDAEEYYKDEEE
jgi:hypothetical protein